MSNQQHYCVCPSIMKGAAEAAAGRKAALLKDAKWQPGSNITIRFLGGSPALQARVRKVAEEWTRLAGLSFDFRVDGPTDIRIAFLSGNGSWSYLGTQCRQIPEPQPTMNYGWLEDATPESELRRVVLHEFGHALGMIHEHQNPQQPIQWNRPAVRQDLAGAPNHWDDATIENNMFRKYENVEATAVDTKSIMMYPIPAAWTLDGTSADFNTELSQTDREFVATAYPRQ
jgi:serralysin